MCELYASAGDWDEVVELAAGVANEDDLTLQIPSDASAGAIRDLLDRLGGASAAVERVSVHTPDLDEVFLALTGDAEEERGALR